MPYRIVLGRPLHPAGAAVLAARADVETIEMFDPPAPALHAALANADGLVAWLERVDKAALAAAPRLRAVSRIGLALTRWISPPAPNAALP
jgi:D-3-phosphoglycerate dehydrogenase